MCRFNYIMLAHESRRSVHVLSGSSMKNERTYRVVTAFLVAVFGVFNVGLPIVVASCPMTEGTRSSVCSACPDASGPDVARLSSVNDYSCCQTVILAERNTTEFIAAKTVMSAHVMLIACVLSEKHHSYSISLSSVPIAAVADSSPPGALDIPIFTSSLLI